MASAVAHHVGLHYWARETLAHYVVSSLLETRSPDGADSEVSMVELCCRAGSDVGMVCHQVNECLALRGRLVTVRHM